MGLAQLPWHMSGELATYEIENGLGTALLTQTVSGELADIRLGTAPLTRKVTGYLANILIDNEYVRPLTKTMYNHDRPPFNNNDGTRGWWDVLAKGLATSMENEDNPNTNEDTTMVSGGVGDVNRFQNKDEEKDMKQGYPEWCHNHCLYI